MLSACLLTLVRNKPLFGGRYLSTPHMRITLCESIVAQTRRFLEHWLKIDMPLRARQTHPTRVVVGLKR